MQNSKRVKTTQKETAANTISLFNFYFSHKCIPIVILFPVTFFLFVYRLCIQKKKFEEWTKKNPVCVCPINLIDHARVSCYQKQLGLGDWIKREQNRTSVKMTSLLLISRQKMNRFLSLLIKLSDVVDVKKTPRIYWLDFDW